MTTTNNKAKKRIGRAISDLLKVRDDYSGLTASERQSNETAITALKAEFFALDPVAANATYQEITMALTGAKNELEEIKDKRDKFQNTLVTASKLLGTLTSVLKLIS